jgi:hypothetical protein
MAASTISPRVVLVDDTGTFAAPNNDGTVINNALFQTLQDRIDALFSTDLYVAGLVVDSFGAHPVFVAAGAGTNSLEVRNLAAGTSNTAAYLLGNDVASGRGSLFVTASNYVTTAPTLPADATVLDTAGAGGLFLRSTGTTYGIQVQSLLPIRLLANGVFSVSINGGAVAGLGGQGLVVQGTPAIGPDVTGVYLAPNCTGATSIAAGLEVNPTLSGQYVYGAILRAPLVVGPHTHAATLTIVGPPHGGGGGGVFYALEIGAGRVWNQGQYTSAPGSPTAPMYSFLAAPGSGMYLEPAFGSYGGQLEFGVGSQQPLIRLGRSPDATAYAYIGTTLAEAGPTRTVTINLLADNIGLGDGAAFASQQVTFNQAAVQFPNMVVLSGANYVHVYTGGPYVNALVKTSSSARYKKAITDLDDDPLRVLALRPRLYHDAHVMPGRPERAFAGLIAEEVAEVLPMLVVTNDAGAPDNVMYDRLPVYLLRALGALVARVEALEGAQP